MLIRNKNTIFSELIDIPNTITNRQMVFILFLTITSITIITLPKDMAVCAGNGFWIPILVTAFVFALFTILIVKLNMMFQGKMLFDYSVEIIGKKTAVILAVFYIAYFLTVSVFLCTSYSNMVHYNFLLKTPQWAELMIGVPLFGYIAYKGVTNVARIFAYLGPVILVMLVIFFATMLIEGRIERILPFYVPSEAGKYISCLKDTPIAFLGFEVLTVIPFTKKNKKAAKTAFLTIIGVGFFYILAVAGTIMMLGINEIVYHNNPLIDAVRLIQYPEIEFLQRVDLLYEVFGFMGVFASKSIVYLAVVEYTCRLLPKVKRIVPVIAAGIIILTTSVLTVNIKDIAKIFSGIITIAGFAAALFIPGILLLIAKVKKRAGKNT